MERLLIDMVLVLGLLAGGARAGSGGSWVVDGVAQGQGGLTVEADPSFTTSVAARVTGVETGHWGQAYGWGDHGAAGYATGTPLYVEADPSALKTDGSVPMTGDLCMGGSTTITNRYGGFQAGSGAIASNGAAIGESAYETGGGGAVGGASLATTGGAVGRGAGETAGGGAVGQDANATSGFSAGKNANSAVDSIQLGTGTNTDPMTLQVYTYQLMDSGGTVPNARLDADLQGWAGLSTNGGVDEGQLDTSVNASLDLADSSVQPTDADYTNTAALATTSLQPAGTNGWETGSHAGYVPTGRTVTINGVVGGLSSNLLFTVGGETDTLASVTARGATTPTAVVVSNDVTSTAYMYAHEFRVYDGASWTNSNIRAVWGACPDMQAYVFCPFPSVTNGGYFPWIFVSVPGKADKFGHYSEALRIETNGNVTLGGQLDMGGWSITNIGTNSLHFVDGRVVSSRTIEQWDAGTSGERRAEGPLAAVLIYLAGWLGGKRRQIAAGLKRLAERCRFS